jgi:O-antigen/teichoic acid export membrane protein
MNSVLLPPMPIDPTGADSALREDRGAPLQRGAALVARLHRKCRPLTAMFDQAIVSGASFLATVLIGRVAGEQQLGLYALGVTLLVLFCGVQESLVLIPYTVFAMRTTGDRRGQLAGSALLQSVLGSSIIVLCLAAIAIVFATTSVLPQLASVVSMLLLTAPLVLLRDFSRRFAFAQMRLGWALAIDGTVAAMQLTLLAWLALSSRLSAVAALTVLAASCGIVSLTWLWRYRGHFELRRDALAGDWTRAWSLGGWLLAGHVTGITQAYALHWLLALLLDAAATGAFAAVVTIVSLGNPFIIGLGNFLMPTTAQAFAETGAEGVWRLATRATLWVGAAVAVFCVLATCLGDQALVLLYGPQYGGQTLTVSLLALAVASAALGIAAEHGLRSIDRPRAVFVANLAALVATLSLAFWLVPRLQIVGAAWALLAGNLVGCLFRWWAFSFACADFGRRKEAPNE